MRLAAGAHALDSFCAISSETRCFSENVLKAAGLFLDSSNGTLVVRVVDAYVNSDAESWWTYRLKDGRSIGKVKPRSLMTGDRKRRSIIAARPLAGAPLALIQWARVEDTPSGDGAILGTTFTLVDEGRKPAGDCGPPAAIARRG